MTLGGTEYLKDSKSGGLVRLGPKKLSKAEKKLLKKIQRGARQAVEHDPGRPVKPHRSGGAQVAAPATFKCKSAVIGGKEMGPCTLTVGIPAPTPAPVRCLTPEAYHDRMDFENGVKHHGCSCHMGHAPCGYCTHPGNPLNQDDDSCWHDVVPPISVTGPFKGLVLKGCAGCPHECMDEEASLRHYSGCSPDRLEPMTPEQRDWCLDEIGRVEGHTRTEAIDLPDDQLATAVIHAWADFARDKGGM